MTVMSYRLLVVVVLLGVLALECPAQDTLSKVVKQQGASTVKIGLEFAKKNRSPVLRALSLVRSAEPNAHASGFVVGDGLVMTSYHVVSGQLTAPKKKLLGFRPDDELEVTVYVNGCQARTVKVDQDADLALLRVCTTSKQARRPAFRTDPRRDEQLLLIAQPGSQKTIRRGRFNGLYTFRGCLYWSVRIDGEDGFSGSPVYNSKGELVGVFSLYDSVEGVALLSPGEKAQKFLADYDAGLQ